jgi:excisionase family DNA binding protein
MDSQHTPKLAYSVDEAASTLTLSRARLYELMNEGQIKFKQCGRRRLIPASAIRTFLEEAA